MKGGSAHAYKRVDESTREELWATWIDFEKALWGLFEIGDRKVQAQDALRNLKQEGHPVEEYFHTFEAHQPYSGLNNKARIRFLRYNLDGHLLHSIYTQNKLPETYDDWKYLAIRKDRQLREERGLSRTQMMGPSRCSSIWGLWISRKSRWWLRRKADGGRKWRWTWCWGKWIPRRCS